MPIKARIATAALELTIEADSLAEAQEVLEMLEKHHYLSPGSTGFGQTKRSGQLREVKPSGSDRSSPLERAGDENRVPVVVKTAAGGTLTLRAKLPEGPGQISRGPDAALVILLAHGELEKGPMFGTSLMKSLRQTGYNLERVDRPLQPYVDQGLVLVSGVKKSRAYHLSEHGKRKARELADELANAFGS